MRSSSSFSCFLLYLLHLPWIGWKTFWWWPSKNPQIATITKRNGCRFKHNNDELEIINRGWNCRDSPKHSALTQSLFNLCNDCTHIILSHNSCSLPQSEYIKVYVPGVFSLTAHQTKMRLNCYAHIAKVPSNRMKTLWLLATSSITKHVSRKLFWLQYFYSRFRRTFCSGCSILREAFLLNTVGAGPVDWASHQEDQRFESQIFRSLEVDSHSFFPSSFPYLMDSDFTKS